MRKANVWKWIGTVCMLLWTLPRTAHAETPTYAYLASVCGSASERDVAFLFTYKTHMVNATAETNSRRVPVPDFPVLPEAEDRGLSKRKPVLASPKFDRTFCAPKPIYAQHGAKDDAEWVNIWVNYREVLHHYPVTQSLAALLVMDGVVKRCDTSRKGDITCKVLGQAESMGVAKVDTTMALGRIAIRTATDQKLCQDLIHGDFQPGDPLLPFVVKPDNHDEIYQILPNDQDTISFRDYQNPGMTLYDARHSDYLDRLYIGAFDISNSGLTQLVAEFSSYTHAFTGDYFVSIPLADASDAAIKSVADAPEDPIGKKGWLKFDGEKTIYKDANTQFQATRIDGMTYLLAWSYNTGPLAVLLKPAPDGSMSTICTFDRVGSDY